MRRKGACTILEHRIGFFCQNDIVAIPLEGPEFSWEIAAIVRGSRPLSHGARIVLDWFSSNLADPKKPDSRNLLGSANPHGETLLACATCDHDTPP